MARLCANENFPLAVVLELRRLGHDVLTIIETGKAAQSLPDEAILALARADRRAVVTLDGKPLAHLHSAQPGREGRIMCTCAPDSTSVADRVHAAIQPEALRAGQLIRGDRPAL